MRKTRMKFNLKTITILVLTLSFAFAPVFGSVHAMSYNYDFWKNIIPSAEGLAHQDTYYADSFSYYKNNEYEAVVKEIKTIVEDNNLDQIKDLVVDKAYKEITSEDYANARNLVNASVIAPTQKDRLNQLLEEKKEFEADPNLYQKIIFDNITDVEVYGDKIYILATPGDGVKLSNITGTTTVANTTQLIVVNTDMEWELCKSEFVLTSDVKQIIDNYYQWFSLRFSSVAVGDHHVIALDTSGNLWTWGKNDKGQLGVDPGVLPSSSEPYQLTWIGDSSAIKYQAVYATKDTSIALDSTGNVYVWGSNENNLLAQANSVASSYVPTKVNFPSKTTISSVSTADDHIYAIDSNNNVWAWGNGNDGLLLEGFSGKYSQPQKIIDKAANATDETIPALSTIVAGPNHTIGIDGDKELWVWGKNDQGQLGLGSVSESVLVPTKLTIYKHGVKVKANSVAVGENHTLVVDSVASLWGFGNNDQLQLGIAVENQATPNLIDDELEYSKVSAYGNTSYAITANYHAYSFGQNVNNLLGINTTEEHVGLTYIETTALSTIVATSDACLALDADDRLWVWGTNDIKLGNGSTEDVRLPQYKKRELILKNISLSELIKSDVYERAVYVASSKNENEASAILRNAAGLTIDEAFIYIADTENSRILKVNKETLLVDDVCLTPNDSTFKNLSLDSSVDQGDKARQFRPTKVAVDKTGRIYCIANQIYEGIIEYNRQGNFNRYLGKNEVVVNPIKDALQNFLSEAQLASFALTLPPLFTNINISDDQFIYATSYPDSEDPLAQKMVKAINTSGKDVMKRNGYVTPDGDAVYLSASNNPNAIIGSSNLVDVAINTSGNFTVVDEVRGRLFTYDSEGNLLYIAGNQPGGNKQTSTGGLSENIIKPVGIDYLYRSYISGTGEVVDEEIIVVADAASKSIMFFQTTEFGKLVNQATAAYSKGVDTSEKAEAVRLIWEEVIKRNSNYELAYLGIGKCLLVESDYVAEKDEQLKLYQQAMENFKLAHSSTYYSKAYSRYRDQVLKDNFNLIMTAAVIVVIAIVGGSVAKAVLDKNKKKKAGKLPVEGDE